MVNKSSVRGRRFRIWLRLMGLQLRQSFNFQLRDLVQVTRLPNLFIIVLTQYFTAIFLVFEHHLWRKVLLDPRLFLLSFSTVLIAAAGYIINDYYDIKIDFINKPARVVIGKKIKRRVALLLHLMFNALALLTGLFLGLKIALIHFVSVFLLWLYSNQLKRLPFVGNFVIGLLTGMSILITGILYNQNLKLVATYSIFAFAITLIREVIKDMEDLKGDANFGCRTLPVVWGIRRTKTFVYILIFGFMFILTLFMLEVNNRVLNHYFLVLSIPMIYFVYQLVKADSRKSFNFLSNFCKLIMLSGVISMAFF